MPSAVSRSMSSSSASRMVCALGPSGRALGRATAVLRSDRICNTGLTSGLTLAPGVQDQNVIDRAIYGCRHAGGAASLDDISAQPIDFQPVAALEVIVHRGGHRRGQAVGEREAIVREVDGE